MTAPIKRAPTLETFRGDDGRWHFHLLAGNKRIMFRSDASYDGPSLPKPLRQFGVDEVFESADGQFHFRVHVNSATATSEGYTRRGDAVKAGDRAVALLASPTLRMTVRDPA